MKIISVVIRRLCGLIEYHSEKLVRVNTKTNAIKVEGILKASKFSSLVFRILGLGLVDSILVLELHS